MNDKGINRTNTRIAMLLILVAVLALTSCGARRKNASQAEEEAAEITAENAIDISGTYGIVETTGADGLTPETVEVMEMNGMTITLLLEEGGNGTLDLLGDATALTYDVQEQTITMGGESHSFTVEGDKLIIHQSGGDMVFEKKKE